MSASSNVWRSRWHQARSQIAEALRALKAWSSERRNALAKANDDLRVARADLERRWRYLEEAQKLSHSGTFGWKVAQSELVWSDEILRILGFGHDTIPTLA